MEDNIYSLDKIAPHSILHISHDSCLKETDYHSHNFFEIAYIAEGSYTHRINGQLQKVKRGNIIFLKIGDKHSYKAETEPCDVINILFYPDLYDDDPETLLNYSNKLNIRKIIQLSNKDIRQVESIIKNMKYEQEFKRKDSLEIMKRYLDILLLVITRSLNEAEPTKNSKIDLRKLQ